MQKLFQPLRLGDLQLPNRIVMAPLTGCRATRNLPNAMMAEYYAQRADAGLIIAEASQVCPEGCGYMDTPGIYSAEQGAGWRLVTDAVHARGGRIAIQLWHVGRISHTSLQPAGVAPVSSSNRSSGTPALTYQGMQPGSTPRALRDAEMPGLIDTYAHAARCAMDAGFDAVEVHGANGYLIDQFFRDSINHRADRWGGPMANRIQLGVQVMQRLAREVGPGRLGMRLSPITPSNGAPQDSQPQALFDAVVQALKPLGLAWLHIIEGQTGGARDLTAQGVPAIDYAGVRQRYGGAWMVNNGYDRDMALAAVASGQPDLVAFGKPYSANPDLVERLRLNAPCTAADTHTYYRGTSQGYTDYARLTELAHATD